MPNKKITALIAAATAIIGFTLGKIDPLRVDIGKMYVVYQQTPPIPESPSRRDVRQPKKPVASQKQNAVVFNIDKFNKIMLNTERVLTFSEIHLNNFKEAWQDDDKSKADKIKKEIEQDSDILKNIGYELTALRKLFFEDDISKGEYIGRFPDQYQELIDFSKQIDELWSKLVYVSNAK